jgi:hypothetical protein
MKRQGESCIPEARLKKLWPLSRAACSDAGLRLAYSLLMWVHMMMTRLVSAFAIVLVAALAAPGCVFFEDDDDDTCKWEATGQPTDIAAYELRDPLTGVCQAFGGGGGCSDPCAPCSMAGFEEAYPDWGQCYTGCEGLDEGTCKSRSACRAVYEGSAYHDCWAVGGSGPIQGGGCSGLDAQSCSLHDDCVAVHAVGTNGAEIGSFTSCAAETNTTDPGSCVGNITCLAAEPACPSGTIAGRRNGCWTGYCIPYAECDTLPTCDSLGEAACISRTDCSPTYEGNNCTCNGQSCTCQSWTFDSCKMM